MALGNKRADAIRRYSDEELMEQIRRKNMEALGELYMRYGRLVSGAIVASVPALNKEEIEDLAQEVFIAVEKQSASYKEQGKLKAWLYSIATRAARRRSRSLGIFNRITETLSYVFSSVGPVRGHAPDRDAIARVDLERMLKRLPPVQREVLILYEHQGLSGDEISHILDIPVNTVWSHLKRGRRRALALMSDVSTDRQRGEHR